MDIRFYLPDGTLVFICADYIRVVWQECLKDEGTSEITVLSTNPLFNLVISSPALLVQYGENQGIVCGYSLEGDYLKITVKSLLTLLKRRIVMGISGEEMFLYSGNPLEIIRDEILSFAPYITFQGEVQSFPERVIPIDFGTDLLSASKQLMEGLGVGMKISFSPAIASYFFSFIYPEEQLLRFSSGNKNLSSVSCVSDFSAVKNSGYYIHAFSNPVEWNPDKNPSAVKNYDPENYMKQYKLLSATEITGTLAYSGWYLYCDTKDGMLKVSTTQKTDKIQYLSYESNPALVFEEDLRKYSLDEARTLLEIRKYISELWNANPISDKPLKIGTTISVEKEMGMEKGLKKLQVISVKTDTEKALPEIELA